MQSPPLIYIYVDVCVCVCVCIVVNKCTQYKYKTVFLYFKRAAAVQSKVVLCVSFHFVFMHFPFDAALQEIKSKYTMNPIVRWKKKLFYSLRKSRTTNANTDNKFRIEKKYYLCADPLQCFIFFLFQLLLVLFIHSNNRHPKKKQLK